MGWFIGMGLLDEFCICTGRVSQWGRSLGRNFKVEIRDCHNKLDVLRHLDDEHSAIEFKNCTDRLARLLAQEEDFWRQRAKIYWLTEGDLNTKYFHSVATARRRRNVISALVDGAGTVVEVTEVWPRIISRTCLMKCLNRMLLC